MERICAMKTTKFYQILTAAATAVALLIGTVGCENLPGSPKQQGTAIGAVGGAAAGAAGAGEHKRLLGGLLGGAVGAGGGYLLGGHSDRLLEEIGRGAGRG